MAAGTLEDELATEVIDVLRDYGVIPSSQDDHSVSNLTERCVKYLLCFI
jgi:predicted RecB family endonuclease